MSFIHFSFRFFVRLLNNFWGGVIFLFLTDCEPLHGLFLP